jgi:putative transcriptional regulator
MGRDDLINTTRAILAKAGFDVSPVMGLRSVCFDVVGRKDSTLLIIKVLSNVDAFSRENAEELKVLAEVLEAKPLLIGERSSSGALEVGIVYTRFNIPIISNDTLADHLLEEVPPFIFAAPGGLYVKLDGDLMKHIREERGISLGALAETAGVSRRTIQMYETGMGAMIDAAIRLEEFLDTPIILPMNPFFYKTEEKNKEYEMEGSGNTQSAPINTLLNLGFSVTPVVRSPFEALTRDHNIVFLTGLGNDDAKVIQKALIASEISKIAQRPSVIIVERKHEKDKIESTAVVSNDEIQKMDDKDQLTELVYERSGKK